MSFADAEQVLRVDPRDSSDMPLRGDGGLHDHDAAAGGEDGEFGAVKPIDQIFDRQRKRLLALVKGDTALPVASPPELFLGTAPTRQGEPPAIDMKSVQPLPIVTPENTAPPDMIDAGTKIGAEKQAYAVCGTFGGDLRAAVIARFGHAPEGVPKDQWPSLIRFYDFVVEHSGKFPDGRDDHGNS